MIWAAKEREAELRGEEKGFAKGFAKGVAEGRMKAHLEIITDFIDGGLPDDLIARVTHTPLSEIQSLRSRLQK